MIKMIGGFGQKKSGFGILRVTAIPYGIKPYLRSLMDVDKLMSQHLVGLMDVDKPTSSLSTAAV